MKWWRELKEEYDNEQKMEPHKDSVTIPEVELDSMAKHSVAVDELLKEYYKEVEWEVDEYTWDEETWEARPTGRKIKVMQQVPVRTKGFFKRAVERGLMKGTIFKDGPGKVVNSNTEKEKENNGHSAQG